MNKIHKIHSDGLSAHPKINETNYRPFVLRTIVSSEIKYDSFMTAETFRNELPRKSSNITFHALYNIIIDV